MKNQYRSSLSIAKNLGSSGRGSDHWLKQRFTAVIMALMVIWVFCFFASITHLEYTEIGQVIKKPYHATILFIFVPVALYHASLGMQVIIEDYIHCRFMKIFSLLVVKIISLVTSISFIVALIHIMSL